VGVVFANKDATWVQRSGALNRLASISLHERTAETRLAAWTAAWQGWSESPKTLLLGIGLENFYTVFNAYFPPIIYEDQGSQVWFDRAHNVIFDRGVTSGILGLGLFMVLLVWPYVHLWRRRNEEGYRVVALVAIPFGVAYLVQDMLVFETIGVYVSFIFMLVFLSQWFDEYHYRLHPMGAKIVAIIGIVAIGVSVNPAIGIPANVTRLIARGYIELGNQQVEQGWKTYTQALEMKTYASQELRLRMLEVYDQLLVANPQLPVVQSNAEQADKLAEAQVTLHPNDVKNVLFSMHHYGVSSYVTPGNMDKALALEARAKELSPTRPHVYQETGYIHFYRARQLQQAGAPLADIQAEVTNAYNAFTKAIDLNPRVIESHINVLMLAFHAGEEKEVRAYLAQLDSEKINYHLPIYLVRLGDIAYSTGMHTLSKEFYEELTTQQPTNTQALIKLALTYTALGRTDLATTVAELIKEIDPSLTAQADQFIDQIKSGNIGTKPGDSF
jgi:tetratricopeptide (TPR) repeat protein